ncbi:hypothetical protein [Pantoea agglomerans]|uniref:hypothetical protein n=1 Tax=Enterobacter agglomerans TaxID=549 RepID=UPI003FD206E5
MSEGGDFRRQATPARRLKAERSDGLCENDAVQQQERGTEQAEGMGKAGPVTRMSQAHDELPALLKMVFVR